MSDLPITGIGTPILILLVILSLVSISIIILKSLNFLGSLANQDNRDAALVALRSDDQASARQKLGPPKTASDRIALTAFDEIARNQTGNLETALEIAGNAEARAAFRHIRTLETIAMVSPLLGLLGTVLGMIQAFRDLEMAEGAANAALLAGGIWQALLTTAAGLIVALPAAAAAALLSARAETIVSDVETTIARILSALPGRSNP